jgi:excisionase family DNA binding protein
MSNPRLNLTSQEKRFILSEDGRRGKLSQRRPLGQHSQKGNAYHYYLRISRGTLDKLMRRHEIPFIKLGKKVLFRKREIDAWLEAKKIS